MNDGNIQNNETQVDKTTTVEDGQSDGEDQPLSPLSREILGKLNDGPGAKKKKPEPMRQPDDGGTARRNKPKRPAPDVEPAYRYLLPFDVMSYKY